MGSIGEHALNVGERVVAQATRAAAITTLQTRPTRLRRDQAEKLREALLPFEAGFGDAMGDAVRAMIGTLDRKTATSEKWTFVMLSPSQNALVVNHIAEHSSRPLPAMKVWALCFEHLRTDTGEIILRRDEIAEKVGLPANKLSEVMTELEEFGAIIRKREKVDGMKGRGLVRYFMNPRVATHVGGAARDDAQRAAPPLRVVASAARGSERPTARDLEAAGQLRLVD